MNTNGRPEVRGSLFALLLVACGSAGESGPGAGGSPGFAGAGGGGGVPSGMGGANGGGGAGGSSGAPATDCAHPDPAKYAAMPAVSFKDDVSPILGFACTASSCHIAATHKAGLVIGNKCGPFDATAKWSCKYPTMPTYLPGSMTDLDPSAVQPYDPAVAAMTRTELLAASTTVNGGAAKRVVPMHPEQSFLLQKLANTQNAQNYTCTNQDTATAAVDTCGVAMPVNGDDWCQGKARTKFDTIAAWIAQGALDN